MIIDVVDLNLKRLDFNQSYDMGRYTKGMHIYSLGRVKENKDEKKDENKNNDYKIMETYIRGIKKLSIRNVVDWKDKIIKITKDICNK